MNAEAGVTDAAAGSIAAAAGDALRAARDQARDTVDLAAAELRLAAMTGLSMLALAILAAALALVGWVLVVAAAAQLGLQAGLSWAESLLGLGGLHVLGAWLCWRSALGMSPQLTLPALRAALLGNGERT